MSDEALTRRATQAVYDLRQSHPHIDMQGLDIDDCALVAAVVAREVAGWLRHINRLDEIPGAKVCMPTFNPLWDAGAAIERAFEATR